MITELAVIVARRNLQQHVISVEGALSNVEMPCQCISEYCKVVCKCNVLFNYGNGLNVQSEHGWRVGAGSKNGAGGRRTNQLTLEA